MFLMAKLRNLFWVLMLWGLTSPSNARDFYRLPEILPPSEFTAIGDDLVRAIDEQDEEKFVSFLSDFLGQPTAKLNDDERDYLYRGDLLRKSWDKRARPLADFIRMGKLHQKTFVTGEGSVLLVFIPEKFLSESAQDGFYLRNFLIKYFMCEFFLKPDGWKMMNPCYGGVDSLRFPEHR
jgi:hypothetical protein